MKNRLGSHLITGIERKKMSLAIYKYFSENAWQIRLRDGRTIYCDDDNRWWLSGVSEYFDTLFLVLSRNNLLPPNPEGDKAMLNFINNVTATGELSDGELIDACLDEFSDLDVTSRKDALLQALLTRFQIAIDLDETPKGITANGEPVWADSIE